MSRRFSFWIVLITAMLALLQARADEAVVLRGKALFEGQADLSIQLGQRTMPARGISCAGCHGRDAGGGAEVQAGPAIDWQSLTARGYDAQGFATAVIAGLRPDGREIGQMMPRFAFKQRQDADALVAYLGQVAALQRTGLYPDRIVLQDKGGGPAFWDAFAKGIAERAPNGIFGRRIAIDPEQPAFAVLGAARFDPESEAPQLFPLTTLVGDEDPQRVRAASASLVAQIRLAALRQHGLQVVAEDAMIARLRVLLRRDAAINLVSRAQLDPQQAHFAVGIGPLRDLLSNPVPGRLYASIDDLARLPPTPGCVHALDPRPTAQPQAPMARYGHVAARVLVEGLRACGPDCTRARLMRAFDDLRVETPAWPLLNYRAAPLTGSDLAVFRQVCNGRVSPD